EQQQNNALLFYTIGQQDFQWVHTENGQKLSYKVNWQDFDTNQKQEMLDQNLPMENQSLETKNPWSGNKVEGVTFPIFNKTLEIVFKNLKPETNLHILLVNTNRQWALEQNKHSEFITSEPFLTTDLLLQYYAEFQSQYPGLGNVWRLDLGSEALLMECFHIESRIKLIEFVEENPEVLDLKNRDWMYPQLDACFRLSEESINALTHTEGAPPFYPVLKDAGDCYLTDSTGIPLITNILRSVIPLGIRRHQPVKLVSQNEHQPGTRLDIPYSDFLNVRMVLEEFYKHHQFLGIRDYLKRHPPMQHVSLLNQHKNYCAWIMRLFNSLGSNQKLRFLDHEQKNPLISSVFEITSTSFEIPVIWIAQKLTWFANIEDFASLTGLWTPFLEAIQKLMFQHSFQFIPELKEFEQKAFEFSTGRINTQLLQTIGHTIEKDKTSKPYQNFGYYMSHTLKDYIQKQKPMNEQFKALVSLIIQMEDDWRKGTATGSTENGAKIRNRMTHSGVIDEDGQRYLKQFIKIQKTETWKGAQSGKFLPRINAYLNAIQKTKIFGWPSLESIEYLPDYWSQAALNSLKNYSLMNFKKEYKPIPDRKR
ncbi:MAG: hypothetical protein HQM12_24355, partial [SAR324 cluster bacterium]|nr:hypothetical protein [SAR324 cluster bacterium]